METLSLEPKQCVLWIAHDEAALHALHPILSPELVRIAAIFYRRIREGARTALEGGQRHLPPRGSGGVAHA